MARTSHHELTEQRTISTQVLKRLADHMYNRPLISNIKRADYVECLVELILRSVDQGWCLTEPWAPWDLEHARTGARLEVKQSSRLQSWSSPDSTNRPAYPSFDIATHDTYWTTCSEGRNKSWKCSEGGYHTISTERQRHADIYVFAWHGTTEHAVADHREAGQWEFYVTPEAELPPGQQSIGLNPLRDLVQPCTYRSLAQTVANTLPSTSLLKAQLDPPPSECPSRGQQ